MSYKSREKKRQARIATERNQRAHRDTMAGRHYLTIVTRPASCNECGGSLRDGCEFVYRHTPRELLCVACADRRGIKYRPSVSWEKLRGKAKRRGHSNRSASAPLPRRADKVNGDGGEYSVGEQHRSWPEWTWDGSAFTPTERRHRGEHSSVQRTELARPPATLTT